MQKKNTQRNTVMIPKLGVLNKTVQNAANTDRQAQHWYNDVINPCGE